MEIEWDLVVVGGGPAGLAAAEVAAAGHAKVLVLEQMPSVGRKLLMAGKSGLNLTMAMPIASFLDGYRGGAEGKLRRTVAEFGPEAVRAWADALGADCFTGSSGKVFPKAMKASPLLRAWLDRLAALGVEIQTRSRLRGLAQGTLPHLWRLDVETARRGGPVHGASGSSLGPAGGTFASNKGPEFETSDAAAGLSNETFEISARAVLLAMGGASWPRLGADGAWTDALRRLGVEVSPFSASNVGWSCTWSEVFRTRFAGHPVKNIALHVGDRRARGELMITRYGLEGGALYALGNEIEAVGGACRIDLAPDRSLEALAEALKQPPGKATVTAWLRKRARLDPVKIGLLREGGAISASPDLAKRIKSAPIALSDQRPIAEAISSAGGVCAEALDDALMLRAAPGVFCAGEMVDWDAPTGGWLLTGCLATGRAAGAAALRFIRETSA